MLQSLEEPSDQHPSITLRTCDTPRCFRVDCGRFCRPVPRLSPPSDKHLLAASTPHPDEPTTTHTQCRLAALGPMLHEPSHANIPPVMTGRIVRLCLNSEGPSPARLSQSQPQPATLEHSLGSPQYFAENPVAA